MTDLVDTIRKSPRDAKAVEHWHATVMRRGVIATVVVIRLTDGSWTARTQLRDRSFNPLGDCWNCGPFDSEAEALHAGQAASIRLHKVTVGIHEVPVQARTSLWAEPVGGYQSQALRRFAQLQLRVLATLIPTAVRKPASEMELMA